MLLLTLLSVCAFTVSARADEVKTYRYLLYTSSDDNRYVHEIALGSNGVAYRVQSDSRGRNVLVVNLIDGDEIEKTVYAFHGDDPVPASYKRYVAGVLTNVVTLHRDEAGFVTREDWYDAGGALSSYATRTLAGNQVQRRDYTASGILTGDTTYTYNADGVLIAVKGVRVGSTSHAYRLTQIDPKTGYLAEQKDFYNDVLRSYHLAVQDANGNLSEIDGYAPDGRLYVVGAFTNDLLIRLAYAGSPEMVVQRTYDSRRILLESEVLVDGRLACRFTYERALDNSILKTQAWGPDGKLWAEFANAEVDQVSRNGTAPGDLKGTVYKTGPGW
jgi:hypothetical protein